MRLAYYAGASTVAAAACLLKAFHQRPNFYSATVYLSQSNACLLILTNLLLVMACSFMYGLQRLVYGPLRPIEIEQLSEKAWYAVLDTLLAMPSFREDVGGWLLTMFVLLLAGKVWGWIGEGRVDVLEQQPPANPRLFHARLSTSLTLSVMFDIYMLNYCVDSVVADPRPGMMVIFTFEFAILSIFSIFTLSRYLLTLMETAVVKKQTLQAIESRKAEIKAERAAARQAAAEGQTEGGTPAPTPLADDEPIEVDENEVDVPGWEEKRRYLFALEVLTDFIKLVIYIVFFTVSITFNGLPMHIMRDVYMTFASFSKRVTDYVAYRKATSDMNARYPDATTEEIRGDSCIVCRESMVAWELPNAGGQVQPADEQPAVQPAATTRRRDEALRAKKLPCGHILHLRCLKAWLERQQVCPTCRRPVVTENPPPATAPAAAGGNQPANGQGGAREAPRPRARMFNLGPLRVGLLNAPNGQMQNILNQMANPEAQNQNQNQNQDNQNNQNNQQGPNHLGLQVPYANPSAAGEQVTTQQARPGTGNRAPVPMQIHLMQLEQRIMQHAYNLGLEQQQLANLRAMEAELARLRTLHIPQQQPVGVNSAQRPVAHQYSMQHMPPLGSIPLQQPGSIVLPPYPGQQPPPQLDELHGNWTQQFGNGHESLPQGMVLPEGWTVMPLQRLGDPAPAPASSQGQPQIQRSTNGNVLTNLHTELSQMQTELAGHLERAEATIRDLAPGTSSQTQIESQTHPEAHAQAQTQVQSEASASSAGPTDGRGSPLFIPSSTEASETINNASETASALRTSAGAAPAARTTALREEAERMEESASNLRVPEWTGSNTWSFDNAESSSDAAPTGPLASDVQAEEQQQVESSASNGQRNESSAEQQPSHSGKGKGRAVEVEDVPDAEADT